MCRLQVRVTANSHRPGLVSLIGKLLYLKVGAPPAEGRANNELCCMLAEVLGIAPSLVSVRFGHMARQKVVEVQGVDEAQTFAILRQRLGDNTRE